jgi:hypothetical protein
MNRARTYSTDDPRWVTVWVLPNQQYVCDGCAVGRHDLGRQDTFRAAFETACCAVCRRSPGELRARLARACLRRVEAVLDVPGPVRRAGRTAQLLRLDCGHTAQDGSLDSGSWVGTRRECVACWRAGDPSS